LFAPALKSTESSFPREEKQVPKRSLRQHLAVPAVLLAAWGRLLLTFNDGSLIPRYLFSRTLATGGDMGSHHYIVTAFKEFFPFSLGGWATGWFAGTPLLEFYFPLPYLLIWCLEHVLGYEVAFKLATVSGPFLLPVTAYALARLLDAPHTVRAAVPAGAVAFLFLEGKTETTALTFDGITPDLATFDTTTLDIFGGFLTSMLAGEFAYSLGLSVLLLGAGLLYRVSRRCQDRFPYGWIAVAGGILGLNAITHMIPTLMILPIAVLVVIDTPQQGRWLWFRLGAGASLIATAAVIFPFWPVIGIGTLILTVLAGWPSHRKLLSILTAGLLAIGCSAFWTLPTLAWHGLTAPSKWVNSYGTTWVAHGPLLWLLPLACISLVIAVVRRHPGALILGAWGLIALFAFYNAPSSAIVNGRFLPLYYLCICLIAAWGIGEIIDLIPWKQASSFLYLRESITAFLAVGLFWFVASTSTKAQPWAAHNYRGYECTSVRPTYDDESKQQITDGCAALHETVITEGASGLAPTWHELQDLMQTIRDHVPARSRLAWEYNSDYGRFGTPRVMENIPFFTDVDTMEGLLIESSASALYHFWIQAEFSLSATGAVPGYQYPPFNPSAAVEHLRHFGTEYFMAETEEVKEGMRALVGVEEIVTTPEHQGNRFSLFRISDTGYIRVPEEWPVQVRETQNNWQEEALLWFSDMQPQEKGVLIHAPGSSPLGPIASTLPVVNSVIELGNTPSRLTTQPGLIEKQEIDFARTEISFRTNAIGEPHYIAVSYFPNWRVEGAEGPYMLSPSLMLVFPTEKEVRLFYTTSPVERVGQFLTLLSVLTIFGFLFLEKRGRQQRQEIQEPDQTAANQVEEHADRTGKDHTPSPAPVPNPKEPQDHTPPDLTDIPPSDITEHLTSGEISPQTTDFHVDLHDDIDDIDKKNNKDEADQTTGT